MHPDNRDSYGVNPGDVHAHIDKVVKLGFTTQALGIPILAEGVREGEVSIEEFNKRLGAGSSVGLAPVEPGRLRSQSVRER